MTQAWKYKDKVGGLGQKNSKNLKGVSHSYSDYQGLENINSGMRIKILTKSNGAPWT